MSVPPPDEPLGVELAQFAPEQADDLAALARQIADIKRTAAEGGSGRGFDIDAVWAEVEAQLGDPDVS